MRYDEYSRLLKGIDKFLDEDPQDVQAHFDLCLVCSDGMDDEKIEGTEEEKRKAREDAVRYCKAESERLMWLIPQVRDIDRMRQLFDAHKRILHLAAPYDLDCFMLYIEWDREPDKKFYPPRRKQLLPIVGALQDLADNKLDLVAISMPPGTGKTTTAIFYLCWLAGREPNKPILGGSHSNSFLRGVYDECLRVFDKRGEYLWQDVFPKVKICGTNAKDMRIDLDMKQRFETLEFSSIGSGNAGKVRAESLLYCDDLVDGLETAMSRDRLDKLWGQYTTDLRQRKIGACRELHLATRWAVHDVIGRLQNAYEDSDRARFLVFPALNENDMSNFDYPCAAGFTTQFYHEQREIMDDVSWKALYMNQPIEREGQLYAPDELRRYFELPDREPDAIVAVCDTKDRGSDYCVMPIIYKYGNDCYLEDVISDNGKPEIVEARLVEILKRHKVQMARFESNSAGGKIAEKIQRELKERGGITKITTKYTTANKETKIVMHSPWVKEHILFKDDTVIEHDREYRKFLEMVCGYMMMGKNKHDDQVDALAMMSEYLQTFDTVRMEVFKRPW